MNRSAYRKYCSNEEKLHDKSKEIKLSISLLHCRIYLLHIQGVDGPSSVYVNVICDRKRTADPVRIDLNCFQREKSMCTVTFVALN